MDVNGGRDYRAIQAAIDAATPGTTIYVHPGTYRQGMIIAKTVDIIGTGGRADVVVEVSGADAVWFQGGDGRLANMTLRQMGGGNWFGIDISGGSPTLEKMRIDACSEPVDVLPRIVMFSATTPAPVYALNRLKSRKLFSKVLFSTRTLRSSSP